MCRISASATTARAASGRATAKRASRSPSGGDPKDGHGQAGSDPGGGHLLEVDISLEELAAILGEELELPRIEPKGQASIVQEKSKYNSIRQTGPESLRHFKRTYLKALRRQISTGVYEPDDPRVVPIKADKQYRSWNTIEHPAGQRGRDLHDGRLRLDDRRAEGDRPHRGVLDRHLAVEPVQGHRNALHHSRRRGQGSRRAHVLPHARERRHADQLGLQGVRAA